MRLTIKAEPHHCDGRCVCPEHPDLPMYWAPYSRQHACQDIECTYGHGFYIELPILGRIDC